MGVDICTSKFLLFIVGLIYWGIAAGFTFLGVAIATQYGHIDEIAESNYTLVPAFTMIAAAVLMVIIGVFMCISSCTTNKCVLATVFSILLIIFLAEAAAAVMGFAYRTQAEKMVKDKLHEAYYDQYGSDNFTTITHQIDWIQDKFECCGCEHNYTDWADTYWGHEHVMNATVPESCCKDVEHCYLANHTLSAGGNYTQQVFGQGCYKKVHKKLEDSLGILVGVALGFALLQILGMISACVLLCRTNTGSGYTTLGEEQAIGLRV